MKNKKHVLLSHLIILFAGMTLFIPKVTQAVVTSMGCNIVSNNDIPPRSLTIYSKAPNNTEYYIGESSNQLSCFAETKKMLLGDDRLVTIKIHADRASIPGLPNIYQTNIKGIGIKVDIDYSQSAFCSKVEKKIVNNGIDVDCILNPAGVSSSSLNPSFLSFKINLVKLDNNFDTGLVNDFPKFNFTYYVQNQGEKTANTLPYMGFLRNGVTLTKAGCELTRPDINFNLGAQQQKDFTSIGSKGRDNTQKIALTCDPNTKYSFKIDGDAELKHQGVIKLSPEPGAASGVGVQLLTGKNNDPVVFGQPKQMGISASSGTNLQEEIDITARYYQIADKVTPGSANASATFTMTYQ
ncbi:fimbrial protein [Yersinia enterocolitica]|uniref:fimbrial protein n=1 Tax=Yersinia enterocolitica TaxID=630 RepID=UPI001D115E39|nr:fimbrial protein [Yersinia enterocolitica]